MLATSKTQLIAAMKKDAVALQGLELQFYFQNNGALGTMAAIIAGFAFTGLLVFDFDGTSSMKHTCFYVFGALGLGFMLLTVLYSTMINIVGPGLALTGPEGSMRVAVDAMRQEQRFVLLFFTAGVVSFHVASISYAFLAVSPTTAAVLVVIILLGFLGLFARYTLHTRNVFMVDENFLSVTGSYQQEDLLSSLEDAAILERGRVDRGWGLGRRAAVGKLPTGTSQAL